MESVSEEERRAGEHGDEAPERAKAKVARAQLCHFSAREQAQKAVGEGDRAGAGDERYEAAIVGKQPLCPRRRARGGGGGEVPRVKERAKAPREQNRR